VPSLANSVFYPLLPAAVFAVLVAPPPHGMQIECVVQDINGALIADIRLQRI
jgi:hypothetical protein